MVADAKQRRDARRAELLRDPHYLQLCAEYEAHEKSRAALLGCVNRYRITAGHTINIFFHVDAQGDTWPEVFAKLQK
jgi:hypothetical protein